MEEGPPEIAPVGGSAHSGLHTGQHCGCVVPSFALTTVVCYHVMHTVFIVLVVNTPRGIL